MNIKLQGINLLGNLGLKSTQDRLNRQAESYDAVGRRTDRKTRTGKEHS
ncbi:MAG: hypothetical protein J6P79_08645 [Pseudobutyrivibrio sp.]|nr:hypothetical protein [Pseudobutyrivibrio sp.]